MVKKKRMPVGVGLRPSTTRLGRFIRQRRLKLGLGQVVLAELTGTSQTLISDIETGVRTYLDQQQPEEFAARLKCNPQALRKLMPVEIDVKPTTGVSQLIRSRREELGLSRQDVANKMGTYAYVVKDLETRTNPRLGYGRAQEVAKALALKPIVFAPYVGRVGKPTTSALGKLVRSRRKALIMSGYKLAKKLRVSPQYVHEIESGRHSLCNSVKMTKRLARVLKLDLSELQAVISKRRLKKLSQRQRPPLAKFFAARRLELGLTQKSVSQNAQISESSVARIETRSDTASIRLLRKLKKALDCQIPPELVPAP